jgi:hypothetical protein
MHCSVLGDDHSSGRLRAGMCERHYRRQRSTGSTASPLLPTLTRYKVDGRGCHVYDGPLYPNGYGKLPRPVHGTRLAHRASYIEHRGPLPAGQEPDHKCRNRACINPACMHPVTRGTNIQLAYERSGTCRNGIHPYMPGGCRPCSLARMARANARRRGH